jgi:hypothetical protein
MKDLSNVEVKQGDIVYFYEQESGDLKFGEVLQVSEISACISQLRMEDDKDGKQEFHRLAYDAVVTASPMIFILPGASQRIPIRDLVIDSVLPSDSGHALSTAMTAAILA